MGGGRGGEGSERRERREGEVGTGTRERITSLTLYPHLCEHTCTCDVQVRMCLRKVRSMKVQDLQLEYGFPDLNTATALRNRWVEAGRG